MGYNYGAIKLNDVFNPYLVQEYVQLPMRIKVKFNNDVPTHFRNNKFLKVFFLIVGAILVISGFAGIIIKICCAEDSVFYTAVAGGSNIFNILLGGSMLYVYSRFKQK